MFEARVEKLLAALEKTACDGFLVTNLTNIYYLTGFYGTAGTVFLSKQQRLFLTDSRYSLLARDQVKGFEIIETRQPLADIAEIIKGDQLTAIGFEGEAISYHYYQQLKESFADYCLQSLTDLIEQLRMIKDSSEIEAIRQACKISDQAFLDVLDFIKPNQTSEIEVANFLDFRMRERGATGPSFDFIVVSGRRSAMPHGRASEKIICQGETLTLDFGCVYHHYVSDITRTIHIGQPSDEERSVYDIVRKSNQAVIDSVKAGMKRCDYDGLARRVIDQAGYGACFTHGIGHGIGLDIHEGPYFGQSTDLVESGMAITDEPGIYLDGKFGVRIEDDILVTETGCEVLTKAPKELIII
ncbi:Aminopeptidase YpdF (MP-, MA-, MS-, AP-, NP-specific) [Streptococcus criceti]|uniref:Peptidase M24 family protein n=1 Tax=Streptococcus criceti HS-6 TaxID=873449 RepID=G5JRX3_STRCG|nr:Xaa-Pro peptidase family protein [Streptococcus criceti]EHI74674.1 peptidase M24 family protein [Streptococcus criceti HS-6]SUN43642.1 Aminopeptidase YpdF (MP-, MA-, MS-, AP-, NP-specific) [Streptococcus criceti]